MLRKISTFIFESIRVGDDVEAFKNKNSSQPEDEFVFICFHSPTTDQRTISLAVRSAIAKLGKIDSKFIHAESSFRDLSSLPFWRWCGDSGSVTTRFIETIELELGCRFTESQLRYATVTDPDENPLLLVRDFIREFYTWYESLETH